MTKFPTDNDLNSNSYGKRFKYIQTLIKRFWKSWTSDYLTELRERHQHIYKMKGVQIKLGEPALIQYEVIPRSQWHIGRVYKLQKGTSVHLNRPVTKLCPLEVYCELRSGKVIPSPKKNEDNSLQ